MNNQSPHVTKSQEASSNPNKAATTALPQETTEARQSIESAPGVPSRQSSVVSLAATSGEPAQLSKAQKELKLTADNSNLQEILFNLHR